MSAPKTIRRLLLVAVPVALLAVWVWAGSSITNLPNGASLEVSIDDPVTCTEFIVPHDEATIDVDVTGTASVGMGDPDATFLYVIDRSGSTSSGSGTGCSPILACEKQFFIALNNAVSADGSTDEVGIVSFGSTASTDLSLVLPANPAVNTTINGLSAGGATNCGAALGAAVTLIGSSTNSVNTIVFASDGLCNTGPAVAGVVVPAGVVVHSIAVGTGSNCSSDGGTGTLNQVARNGGQCFAVPDPGNLPSIIQNLIGSTLDSLDIEVDGGGQQPIGNADITPDLPQPGAASVDYTTTVTGLDPNEHDICVTANGSDVTGSVGDVTQCETIHLLQLTASPESESNDLNLNNQHTVTAAIGGGTGPDRDIDFAVSGQNAGSANPSDAAINAPPNSPVEFAYTVPQDCASLGTDTITVSTVIASTDDSIELTKEWVDLVAPEVSCDPTVNPHGKKQPQAPGTGQNEDGFYQLNAQDPNLANCTVTLQVTDGSGFVFPGPFLPGVKIKYTQADGAPQAQKPMGSGNGQAGAIAWHLIGHGDLTLTGTDPSGNQSSAICLVPPPPK
jgi:hypothetical protein